MWKIKHDHLYEKWQQKKSSHESEDFLLHAIEQITRFAILH